ncbi:predicted protein [Uncinocarpus reesii 1704]|uniref:Retrotransposon gag domain-containing protein n=1 Tax=Uncinocarpus reesii (strain UAMH 1704) TaxID=336963 RepID=C4JQT6_UNCRE|nr:uncharacterized protein UREG_03418 [Uncinocarpus reesii 1704]EEP78572.1 predicted protein [Uncinocarpus reesii 1704]
MNMKKEEFKDDKEKMMAAASYLQEAAFNWFNIYLQNYYKKEEVDQDDNMLKVINHYNIFIKTLKTTFREVEE